MAKSRSREKKAYQNRSEVKAVKREMLDTLKHLNKSILDIFGLDENDNIGMMTVPTHRELDNLLKELDEVKNYYGGLIQ